MDLLSWPVLIGFISIVLTLIYFKFRAQFIPGVKTPSVWPFFGSALDLDVNDFFTWEGKQFLKLGDSWNLALPAAPPTLNTIDPEIIKYVLQDEFNNFEKGEEFRDIFSELLGDGIFAVDGEKWRRQRKAASHLFSLRVLRDTMAPIFVDHLGVIIRQLSERVKENPAFTVDVQRLMFGFTMDCFTEIAFGVKMHETADALENKSSKDSFGSRFDRAQEILGRRYFNPFFRMQRALNIGIERELGPHLEFIHSFCANIVNQRLKNDDSGNQKNSNINITHAPDNNNNDIDSTSDIPSSKKNSDRDLLQMFIDAKDEKGNKYSSEWLETILVNFLVAGRDTTAALLSWAIWRMSLAENAHMLAKLRNEINHAMEQSEVEGEPGVVTFGMLNLIPYSYQVIMEVLRLHPSVPSDGKTTVRACVLPNGVHLPAGSGVFYAIYASGRSEKIWGPDALTFRPERWAQFGDEEETEGASGKPKSISNFTFPHFNAGPRLCLGKQMALTEARMVLCTLLHHFTPRLVPGRPTPTYKVAVTLQMKDELLMTFTPAS